MKKNDVILLVCVVGAALLSFIALWSFFSGTSDMAIITVDGVEYARLPLDTDTELTVNTEYGTNVVVIKDGAVLISNADCPDKTCVRTGAANELKSIVCLPHKLTVTVEKDGVK